MIETWRREYNQERLKKALGGMTPEAYAKHLADVRLQSPRTLNSPATESGGTSRLREKSTFWRQPTCGEWGDYRSPHNVDQIVSTG